MTTGKSILIAATVAVGTLMAGGAVDAIWMLHQTARGVPGQQASGVDMVAVGQDLISPTGLILCGVIFVFVFAIAKIWRDELRG